MTLVETNILNAIKVLKSRDEYSVKNLAEYLNVSRTSLYNNFPHLLPGKSKETEDKILSALKRLQARTSKSKHTIVDIAKEAGVTRQCISKDYKHLIPYIKGEKIIETPNDAISVLKGKLLEAEAKLETEAIKNNQDFEGFKNSVFSQFMKNDIDSFKGQDQKANIVNLQKQNDDLVGQNKDMLQDLAELRTEVLKLKRDKAENPNGCNIAAHLVPSYDAIKSNMKLRDMMELFFKAEEENMDKAISVCFSTQPDAIILFQPFLSCEFDNSHLLPSGGKIVVIETNHPQPRLYQKLLSEITSTPIHALSAKGQNKNLMMFVYRKKYRNTFSEEFIDRLKSIITHPNLEDGFKSVSYIKPNEKMSVVK
ncbi:hypothetical protein L4D76_13670 [Photobacterium sagamiensis]|uniref:HTH domain-containing protein n=1 Tax=Photobacterium sagamiensis TaxID=2910241 RepID=UPI003D0FD4C3